MHADIIIAAICQFGQPEIKIGLMPEQEARSVCFVPLANTTMKMVLTGDMISADEADNGAS